MNLKKILAIVALISIIPIALADGTVYTETIIGGGTVDIQVHGGGIPNLYGYQFDLEFNDVTHAFDSITYSEVVMGTLSGPQEQFCIDQGNLTQETGAVRNIACTRVIAGTVSPADPDTLLATVTLTGTTAEGINLTNVIVSDDSANEVTVTVIGCAPENIICQIDADCDDSNPDTTDTCLNEGTCIASCSNVAGIPDCGEGEITEQCDCGGSIASVGYCCSGTLEVEPTCDDSDSCTEDSVYDGGEDVCDVGYSCVYTPIPDCSAGPTCGNDTCDTGEDSNNCPADCDSGGDPGDGDPGGGGNGGGGGGGGGALGSEGYKAMTRGLGFDELKKGTQTKATIKVSHGFPRASAMTVQLHIFKGKEIVFTTEKSTALLEGGRTYILEFDDLWTPEEGGDHRVVVSLSSLSKEIYFDIQEITLAVGTGDVTSDILGNIDDLFTPSITEPQTTTPPEDSPQPIISTPEIDLSGDLIQTIAIAGLAIIVIAGILIILIKKKKK